MLDELHPGKVFQGRYEVVRCIKAGGMGAVYEVVHIETKRHRAMKVMLPSLVRDESLRSRFRMEAQITADVESDHIVETFDAGIDPETGAPFLVMELLRGEDLAHHLHVRGPLPPQEVVGLLVQLARALDQTHAAGIVHRDLKPENLFIAVRGDDPPRLKVLDFGIAKIVAHSSTLHGSTSVGTPLYMAPEQLHGTRVSPRTDLFALGHIAFALLTGKPYWADEAETVGILPLVDRLARGAVEPPKQRAARRGVTLPAAFDDWFAKATASTPGERFERARDQVADLAAVLGVTLQSGTIPTPVGQPGISSHRGGSPGVGTAPAAYSIDPAATPGHRPPLSWSGAFAPTRRSAEAGGEPAERAEVQTHHASVRNVPAASPRAGWRRALAVAASLAALAAIVIGLSRRAPDPPTATAAPVVESAAAVAPPSAPFTVASAATASAPEPSSSAVGERAPRAPRAAPPPPPPPRPPKPKRDPTLVAE